MLVQVLTVPRRIAEFPERTMVHFQVATGPAQVRLASSRQVLLAQVAGLPQGLLITSSGGIYSLWWKGELWVVADIECFLNLESA